MANTTKITKKMILNAIKETVKDMEKVGDIDTAEVIKYVDTTIEQLDKKNEKAREKAAEKKASGDELYNAVLAVLTTEPMTRDAVLAALNVETTVGKVGARLVQLVDNGLVTRSEIKTEDKRTVKAYALVATTEDAE